METIRPRRTAYLTAAAGVLVKPPRLPKLVAAAAVVGIVVAAALLIRSGHRTPAYAGWTPTSRTATADEMLQISAACNTSNGRPDVLPPNTFDLNSYSQIRGNLALIVHSIGGRNGFYFCLAEPQAGTWSAVGFGARTLDTPRANDNDLPDVFGSGNTAILAGQSRLAASVELDVPGLPTATAPVVHGVYAVFWPGQFVLPRNHEPVRLQLRLLDNTGRVIDTITL
jgi:hypothetical protein